jgi:DNA-binding response OmpR family regulator
MKCLLVEDDERVRALQVRLLTKHGIDVIAVGTITDAVASLVMNPEIILLDLSLPGTSGFQAVREMRKVSQKPIIIVSGRSDRESIVQGLSLGADDYITKPFFARELVARIATVMRRCSASGDTAGVYEGWQVDYSTRSVTIKSASIDLTRKEFEIIAMLARMSGAIVRREQILGEIWGVFDRAANHSLESHITTLRRKIEPHGEIKVTRGVGYSLIVKHIS